MKRIYIEGIGLVEDHFSGIGQYILGILKGLDKLVEDAKLNGEIYPEIRVIIPWDTVAKFNSYEFKHIRYKKFPLKFKYMAALWHKGKMPPIDLFFGSGYYLFTRFVTMPLAFSKSGVIIYDLSYELYRQYADEKNAIFLSNGTKKSIKQVSDIFTISESAKKEIIEFYKVDSSEVSVSTPAADQRYFYKRSSEEIEMVKNRYGVSGNYILALSNLEPRKNLETLVDAYCNLPKKYRDNVGLLLVGVSAWKSDVLFDKIMKLVDQGYNIMRPIGYVEDQDKPAIISGAKMLVYPSHYEGFGMPPLEALACGIPVITSDNSSLPEVVGSIGKMLNCNDVEGFTKEIIYILDNQDKISKKYQTDGPLQAQKFSWESSAKIYWDKFMENSI